MGRLNLIDDAGIFGEIKSEPAITGRLNLIDDAGIFDDLQVRTDYPERSFYALEGSWPEFKKTIPETEHEKIENSLAVAARFNIPPEEAYRHHDNVIEMLKQGEMARGAATFNIKAGASLKAGIGDVYSTIGNAMKWLDINPGGVADDYLEYGARFRMAYIPPMDDSEFSARKMLNPEWFATTVLRSVPFTLSLIPAAVGGAYGLGAGAGAVGIGAFGKAVLGAIGAGTLARTLESTMEAGNTYEEALKRGMTDDEADKAANDTFWGNMALIGLDATQFFLAFTPLKLLGGAATRTLARRVAATVGKIAFIGATEAGEEAYQDVIQRHALGDPVKLDPQMKESAAIGAIFGVGLGGAGSVFTALKSEVQKDMPPEVREPYTKTKEGAIAAGWTLEQAELKALDAMADTPEGKTHIEASMKDLQARAVGEAEIAPVAPPEVVERAEIPDADIEAALEVEGEEAQVEALRRLEGVAERPEVAPEGEAGFIDLTAEMSLAPVIERLRTLPATAKEAGAEVQRIANSVYAEGKTTIQDFTTRMKEVLGDLYEKFKAVIDRVYQAAKAFNERLGEVGAIELPSGKRGEPVFDPKAILEQEFSRELREEGYTQVEVLSALEKVEQGQPVTERQRTSIIAALSAARETFIATVQGSRGDFIDVSEFLDEAMETSTKQIDRLIKKIKVQKPSQLQISRAEMKAERERAEIAETRLKERTTRLRETQAEAFRLEDELAAERKTRDTALTEIVKQYNVAKKANNKAGMEKAKQQAKERLLQTRAITIKRQISRESLVAIIKQELPLALRGKFLTDVSKSMTEKEQQDVGIKISRMVADFQESETLRKKLGTLRSKVAYIKMIGEMNQTLITDAKKKIGLDKPIRQADEEQLNSLISELKARLRFKKSLGFTPKIEGRGSKKPDISQELYEVNTQLNSGRKFALVGEIKRAVKTIPKALDIYLGIVSTRLGKIDVSLKNALRKFEFNILMNTKKDIDAIRPFALKTKEMKSQDYAELDFALKNGDTKKINELIGKHSMQKEFDAVRKVLDALYERADSVGYDIGYLENYYPRTIKDTKKFLNFMEAREDWSAIKEAINRKSTMMGRDLELHEQATLINTMIRGYGGGQITLSATGNMKNRIIDFVTPEMNEFYTDSAAALIQYISSVNEKIEARKFFGKTRVDQKVDQFNNMDDSVGAYTAKIYSEGRLTVEQEKDLRDILTARFAPKGVGETMGVFKNLSYIDVMGSAINAITQIGDSAFVAYNAGVIKAGKSLGVAIVGKSRITKEDIGLLKNNIAAELGDSTSSSALVDLHFRLIGLTKIDALSKEALLSSAFAKYQKLAENPTPEFRAKLDTIFDTDEIGWSTDDVLQNLRDDNISEPVKYLVFNELSDYQPITLSEVPQKYLSGGNGRIFYMLKTWTLKMLDVYRREVFIQFKTDKKQAVYNMLRLSAFLILLNGTADEIKDLMLGRKTTLSDRAVNNILKLVGFSRYSIYQVQRDGLGSTVIEQILPPTKLLDNLSEDVRTLYTDYDKGVEISKFKTLRDIPLIGEFYYWWFGKGVETKEREERRQARGG